MMMRGMKFWCQWLVLATISLLAAWPCSANWKLDRYEGHVFNDFREYYTEIVNGVEVPKDRYMVTQPEDPEFPTGMPTESDNPNGYSFQSSAPAGGGPGAGANSQLNVYGVNRTFSPGSIKAELTVTPVYKWEGSGPPTQEFYVIEHGQSRVFEAINSQLPNPFTEENPYEGHLTNIDEANNGFDKNAYQHSQHLWPPYWNYYSNHFIRGTSTKSITKVSTGGQTEVRGTTRTLTTKLSFQDITMGGNHYNAYPSVSIWGEVLYEAQVCTFEIAVGLGGLIKESGVPSNPNDPNSPPSILPYDRSFEAYAGLNWTNPWVESLTPPGPTASPEEFAEYEANMAKPSKFFWDGHGGYSVNMSSNLSSVLANKEVRPQFEWSTTGDLVVTAPPPSGENDTAGFQAREQQIIGTDTQSKDLHHNVQEYPVKDVDNTSYSTKDGQWPKATETEVTVNFSGDVEAASLSAKAKVDWYNVPETQYRSETKFEVIDLDTGEISSLAPDLGPQTEEELIDQYIADITATKQVTLETGAAMVELALTGEMIVGSWFVPDEYDIALGVGGKVFKSVKAIKLAVRIVQTVNKFGPTTLNAVKTARTAANKTGNVVVRVTTKVFKTGNRGKLPPGGSRANQPKEELEAIEKCYFGEFCFVAGTQVSTPEGLAPIEQLKSGDLVWSKDDSTGDVKAKRIIQTFTRQAPGTLLLHFSNGERIETTAEHPFYLEEEGFTPAGLLAIGNSIVTRAGPPLAITSIEKGNSAAEVYNFSVEDYHTYFVGNSALWVHNAIYEAKGVVPSFYATDVANGLVVNGAYRLNPTSGVLSPQLDNGFIKVTQAGNLFVNNQRFTGNLMYVVDDSGNVIFGLRQVNGWTKPDGSLLTAAHPTLIGGVDPKVRVAGMVRVSNGKIMSVNRASGHFQPTSPQFGAARAAFENHRYIMHEKFDWDEGFVDGY